MYTSFYNLKTKPFQLNADPKFLWLGEMHKEALAKLKYGVLSNEGFLLLTGDVGTGKTTLINTLIQSLTDDVICASVSDPSLSKLELFNYIAFLFGIKKNFSTKASFIAYLQKFLLDTHNNKKKALLIIDESQLLTPELLEEIRLLSNIEKTDTKLISIFLVGQNELITILRQERNRAVRQRLKLNYNIGPLTPNETDQYIKHRLKVAGADHAIFEPDAVQEIFICSRGYPRRINVICDLALLSGYVNEKKTIDATIAKECVKELDIQADAKNQKIISIASSEPVHDTNSTPVSTGSKHPQTTKNRTRMVLTGIITFVLVFAFCWWFVFPISYQAKMKDSPNVIKYTIHQSEQIINPINEKEDTDNAEASSVIGNPQEDPTMQNSTVNVVQDHLETVSEKSELPPDEMQSSNMQAASYNPEKEAEAEYSNSLVEAKTSLSLPEETFIVRFDHDSNTLSEEWYSKLTEFADALAMHADIKLLVAGYTDTDGSQSYNLKLSEFRANMIKTFLIGKGVAPDRMEAKGFGSLNPLESNDTSWGRMMNRRVEINILK